jgi:FixJ family two-component response regulator
VAATPKISIVDDDESVRIALAGLLRSLGYEARSFASAEEFLNCGEVQNFDCLITDIQMPGMSGIELQQHLSASNSPVPVIMITARPELALEEQALSSGAVNLLRKPFEAAALIDCLQKVLNA